MQTAQNNRRFHCKQFSVHDGFCFVWNWRTNGATQNPQNATLFLPDTKRRCLLGQINKKVFLFSLRFVLFGHDRLNDFGCDKKLSDERNKR